MKRSLRNSILTILAVFSFGVALSATRLKLPALNRGAAAPVPEVVAVAAGDADESAKDLAPASRPGRDVVLQTDKLDYRAGEVVVITGAGFEPGETVTLLLHEEPAVHKDRKVAVVADAFGEIFDNQFTQDADHSGVTFIVTAIGKGSGLTTQAAFGNPSATLDQWANLDGAWVNGNLGASKARYFEGDSIPYRLRFGSLPLTSHTVTIEWDTTKADKHALDYLTTFNRSAAALPCLGVAGCGSSTTFPIPVDPQVSGAGVTPIAGNFTIYGGTITSVSAYTYANGAGFTGDKSAQITITFTASVANPVLSWGGHISTRLDWGELNSCVNISGSPFHTRLLGLNGSGGNQDRSLSSDATIFPARITIIKQATPEGSTSFPFTATPTPLSGFSLTDDGTVANVKVFDLLNTADFKTYTITESAVASWTLDGITCSVTSANGGSSSINLASRQVSLSLKEGESRSCTFTNSAIAPKLTVTKVLTNNTGGTKQVSDFPLFVDSTAVSSGVKNTFGVGAHVVSETQQAGYELVGITGDCAANGNVTLAFGDDKSCTITNRPIAPKLTVTKVINNNTGGTKQVADFPLFVDTTSVGSGVKNSFSLGAHTVSETQQTGYELVGITGDCAANGSITLNPGDDKSCTITNQPITPKLTVIKVVINNNGGTKQVSDFPLFVDGNSVTSGVKNTFSLGAHTVSETPQAGYELVGITGDCASNGSVTLNPGDDKTCTITNDDSQRVTTIRTIMSWTLKDAVDLGPNLVRGACGSAATITFRLYRHDLGTAKEELTCDAGSFVWESAPLPEVNGAASTSHDVEEDGIYLWVAVYSGDSCNSPVTSGCGKEVTEITDEDLTPESASPICTPAS